jgi:3-hydroxyacyl-[acyl-carrier-protein] dehydratase
VASSTERAAIEALLPHREPFLLVDRITDRGDDWIETEWHVAEDLDVFRGHYPGNPVLPGVLISEHCFQSAALLVGNLTGEEATPGVPVLTRIEDARFRRMVRPGHTLRTRVQQTDRLANACWFTAQVTSEEGKVARLAFVLALAEGDDQ